MTDSVVCRISPPMRVERLRLARLEMDSRLRLGGGDAVASRALAPHDANASHSATAKARDDVDDYVSTEELGWLLGRSAGAIRRMIRDGEIEAVRVPGALRIPRVEAMRLSRERIEAEAGRTVRDRELERLIDDVLTTNREQA